MIVLLSAGLSCVETGGMAPNPQISIIERKLTTDEAGNTILEITIKNTGRVKADLAEVAVKFYDLQKNLLDSNRDSIINLGIDEIWEFRIPCSSALSRVSSYEIETNAGAGTSGL
jgi:hypothetical protein